MAFFSRHNNAAVSTWVALYCLIVEKYDPTLRAINFTEQERIYFQLDYVPWLVLK